MKLYLSFVVIIAFSITALSQERSYPSVNKDTLFYSNDVFFVAGQSVKLGTGTMPNGSFKFITISRNSWVSAAGSPGVTHLGGKSGGQLYKINKVKVYGNDNKCHTYYLMLAGIGTNLECDVVNALASGELIHEKYTVGSPSNSPVSTADELKKLKELHEAGALTDEEYTQAKAKVISK